MEQKARIIPSIQLTELKLADLAGEKVVIVEPQKSNKTKFTIGYWVRLDHPYQGEIEWFIPKNSIVLQ